MILEILKSLNVSYVSYVASCISSKKSVPLIRPLRDCGSQIEARWNIQLRL